MISGIRMISLIVRIFCFSKNGISTYLFSGSFHFVVIYLGVPKIGGKLPKWMVYNGKPYLKRDDLGGFSHIFEKTPIYFKTEGKPLWIRIIPIYDIIIVISFGEASCPS